MIIYQDNLNNLNPEMLNDFFDGWKKFPSKEKHFKSLQNSEFKILAIDDVTNKVIGTELIKRMLEKLKHYYMIDIMCDESLQSFYGKFGLIKSSGMILRNYDKQN